MSKLKHLAATAALSLTALSANAATLVAGWDFSQYDTSFGQVLTTDGSTLTNQLSANYSGLDATNGLGAESAAFGTMTLPFAPVGDGSEPFLPVIGSLASNLAAPGVNPFDSFGLLFSEGQQFTSSLRMASYGAISIVFEADLASVPEIGSDWSLSFGAQSMPGEANSVITIEFSTDGATWASVGSANVNAVDTAFTIALAAAQSDRAFVRLGFQPGAAIDNVAIAATLTTVPEPATAVLLGAGLLGLGLLGRRRD